MFNSTPSFQRQLSRNYYPCVQEGWMQSVATDSAVPRCCPPSFPRILPVPCMPRGQIRITSVLWAACPRRTAFVSFSVSQSNLGVVSTYLGCAGEAERRTSLRLWLEGPKQVESGASSTLRRVGRTKAVGVQVCEARRESGPAVQCVGRHLA